ncbi:hypothetical protein AXG93_3522s1070 [Marchantia polymorpha subsp. ruderalis]|uniref:Uncharacterized protein n=1 Tax=Marchantia polymorpha subsp. ruderalis TaxID=1480154 RepID=A0A176WCC8_MARPO|nr:hypothetical protein AXG93_3522s1070 [Marchantia polymorpha subsp. ruderalis]
MANFVSFPTTMSGKTKVAMTLARMASVERLVIARMIDTMTRMVQTMRKTAMTVAKVTTRSEKISKATEATMTLTSRNVNPRVSGRESYAVQRLENLYLVFYQTSILLHPVYGSLEERSSSNEQLINSYSELETREFQQHGDQIE